MDRDPIARDEPLDARAEAELRRLAYRDHLTGLPNRIAMADRIEAALARSRREGTSTALVFVDMDGFKRVNDTLGHAAGDELLALVAERLRAWRSAHHRRPSWRRRVSAAGRRSPF